MDVWLAEDATAIVSRVEYKPDTDQIIGYVPTLMKETGLPEVNAFPATSISIVKKYVDEHSNNKSKSVYAIVAIPLCSNASPYVLCIYGTDNKFSYMNVLERWSYIKTELAKQGIICHGNSSDADPRLLKAMKVFSKLGSVLEDNQFEKWKGLFFADITSDMFCLQDLFHIISKMRTRLLETSCPMRIGNHKISLTTLRVSFSIFIDFVHF